MSVSDGEALAKKAVKSELLSFSEWSDVRMPLDGSLEYHLRHRKETRKLSHVRHPSHYTPDDHKHRLADHAVTECDVM